MPKRKSNPPPTPPLIEEALERFALVVEAESALRAASLDDLEFSTGNQWPDTIRAQRERDGRPCLTMDKIQQSIRLVCNEYRQQRPAIQVNPIGDGADTDTAEILQGIIRHIEVVSDAEIAYDGAHESVVRIGFGSWRILSDYSSDDNEDQEVMIEPIRNPFSVYWQPGVPHSKAEWAFIVADIPRETYERDYKDSELASADEFTSIGNKSADWLTKEYIRVAEYFTVEMGDATKSKPKRKITWHKINAYEELEPSMEVPGTSIPIFTAFGDDIDINGTRFVAGLVRNGKDPQRMSNYWNSAATEMIALAPKAPWVAAMGQLEGVEKLWEQSNVRNITVLQYKTVDVAGKPAPPPQRQQTEPPIQAINAMLQQASLDLKAALGLYDPSLGQKKGDESGIAIGKLQQQGDVATLNFSDNMAREMRHCGRILLEWIRATYDTPRVARIIMPDGAVQQVVTHNGPDQKEEAEKLLTDKIKKIYDIGTGRYDVAVAVGPSYQSKRQQAVATQLEILKGIPPQMVPMFIDLIIRNMDIPQAKEIADRAKKMLPPQLQDDDTDPQNQISKLQSQLQQTTQQHQQLVQALNQANQTIESKKIETDAKTSIALIQEQNAFNLNKMKIEAQITVAEIESKAQVATERAQMFQDVWKELHGAAHEKAMQEGQQQHEQGMAAQGQQADQQAQASGQGHEAAMSAQQQAAQQQMADQENNNAGTGNSAGS